MAFLNTGLENQRNLNEGTVSIEASVEGGVVFDDLTITDIILAESLLTPGLQTVINVEAYLYNGANYDQLKNKMFDVKLWMPFKGEQSQLGNLIGLAPQPLATIHFNQLIYRMDNRQSYPHTLSQTQKFTIHCCDPTLISDARTLVSKSWKCTRPSQVVSDVLNDCVKARHIDVEDADPARDYIAERIHPFQVIAQQSNVALANGNDPSFVHFMTYNPEFGSDGLGVHCFKSLANMAKDERCKRWYLYSETGAVTEQDYNKMAGSNQQNPKSIIGHTFPCDWDYLSDVLNGIDETGNINTLATFNPNNGNATQLNGTMQPCSTGANLKQSYTNKGTAEKQNSCNTDVESHLLKRQARMGLLEKDKVALRITMAYEPIIHVGDVIHFTILDKEHENQTVYGTGYYLVASLMHRVMLGGFTTTTIDCVANSVAQGIV